MPNDPNAFPGETRRVAVMQPYLFPYFPYIQLLACVDTFVVFDTAQFISRGWANRNLIELDGHQHRFVLPVRKSPRDTPFSDIVFAQDADVELVQLGRTLGHAYRNSLFPTSPQQLLDDTFPLAASAGTPFVDAFERMSFSLMEGLSFRTRLIRASDVMPRGSLAAEDYIIRLTKEVGGSEYVNPIGGTSMYDQAKFAEQGVQLSFLQSALVSGAGPHVSSGFEMSILHAIAHFKPADLGGRLTDFTLVDGP